jgi:Mg-chelatase subunit ChlD
MQWLLARVVLVAISTVLFGGCGPAATNTRTPRDEVPPSPKADVDARVNTASPACADDGFAEVWQPAIVSFDGGDRANARRQFTKSRDLCPAHPGPWRYLSVIAKREGHYSECMRSADEALRLDPTSSDAATVKTIREGCRSASELLSAAPSQAVGECRFPPDAKQVARDGSPVPLAVVLALDRSGSMGGERLDVAKASVLTAVDALGANELAAIVAFNTDAEVAVPVQFAAGKAEVVTAVNSITADGGTDFYPTLILSRRLLGSAEASKKLVIVFSDGQGAYDCIEELAKHMRNEGITISAIAIGDADPILLGLIVNASNGKLYEPEKLDEASSILVDEIRRVRGTGTAP